MKRAWIAILVCVGVSLVGDYLCRSLAGGTDAAKLIEDAATRVKLPDRLGSWVLVKSEPFEEKVVGILKCKAHENRVYRDQQSGDTVTVSLMAGTSGPLVAHRAEVCYGSTNFTIEGEPRPIVIRESGESEDKFYQLDVQSRDVGGELFRIYYAWRLPQGPWLAPKNPRLELLGQPMLYKLQLIGPAPAAVKANLPGADACRRFLNALLPKLETALEIP